MKPLLLPIVALLAALARPSHAAIDFSQFSGFYIGNYRIATNSPDYTGQLTARVTTNKSGKRLTIELYGALTQSGTPGATSSFALLQLRSNRQVSSNSALIGFPTLFPAESTFAGRTKTFTFTLSNTTPFDTTVAYVLKFTKRRMILTGIGTAGGSIQILVDFAGTKK